MCMTMNGYALCNVMCLVMCSTLCSVYHCLYMLLLARLWEKPGKPPLLQVYNTDTTISFLWKSIHMIYILKRETKTASQQRNDNKTNQSSNNYLQLIIIHRVYVRRWIKGAKKTPHFPSIFFLRFIFSIFRSLQSCTKVVCCV